MDINCLVCHQQLVHLDAPESDPPDNAIDKSTVQDLTSHFSKLFDFPFDTFFTHFDSSFCPSCSSTVTLIGTRLRNIQKLEAEISVMKGQLKNSLEAILISGYKSSLDQSQNGHGHSHAVDRHFQHRSHLVQGLGLVHNKIGEEEVNDITPLDFLHVDFEEQEEEEGDIDGDGEYITNILNNYGGRAIKSDDKNGIISLIKLGLPTGQNSFKMLSVSEQGNKYGPKISTRSKNPPNQIIKKKNEAIIKKEKDLPGNSTTNSGNFMYCTTSGCDYKTRFQNLMNVHAHVHRVHLKTNKRFGCRLCEYTSTKNSAVVRHVSRNHPTEKIFTCEICGNCYLDASKLETHLSTHDESSRIFKCDVCFKGFTSRSRLNTHQETHKDTSQTCHVCKKVFKNKRALDIHMKSHTKRSFICSKCGKSLVTESSLNYHVMRCRLKEFPFNCSKCPKKYVNKAELAKHFRVTHEGITFDCTLCDKKYNEKTALNVHLRSVHTGEKPYKCLHCEKVFASLRGRNVHQGTHNQNVENFKYKCKFCDKKFLLNKYLHQHMTRTRTQCKAQYLEERRKNKMALIS